MRYESHKDQQLRRVFATRAEFAAWYDLMQGGTPLAGITTFKGEFNATRRHLNRLVLGFRNAYGPNGSPDDNPPITRHQRERIHMGALDYDYLTPTGWNSTPDQVPERDIEVRITIMAEEMTA